MEGSFVLQGAYLGPAKDYEPGEGTYLKNECIFASIPGKIAYNHGKQKQEIMILTNGLASLSSSTTRFIKIGAEVLGKVIYIKEDMAIINILAIENEPLKQPIEGVLRKKNIREFEIDKIKVEEAVVPGDIVKARIVSMGDSRKIYLSTSEDGLGVLFARHHETKKLMLPYDWKEMICPFSGLKEPRKVCKPDFSIFQP